MCTPAHSEVCVTRVNSILAQGVCVTVLLIQTKTEVSSQKYVVFLSIYVFLLYSVFICECFERVRACVCVCFLSAVMTRPEDGGGPAAPLPMTSGTLIPRLTGNS